jgi:hypothetical protein
MTPDELLLGNSYIFQVIVENNGSRFAGELSLTPQICTLVIRGDIWEDRRHDFDFSEMKELVCDLHGATFILIGLILRKADIRHMERSPKPISHFVMEYEVSYSIYSRTSCPAGLSFSALEIKSRSIANWVGATTTQDEIFSKYNDGTLFDQRENTPLEFEQLIQDQGILRIGYAPSTFYTSEEFEYGLKFSPVLSMDFFDKKSTAETIKSVGEFNTIFSFLTGGFVEFDRIRLLPEKPYIDPPSLYFSHVNKRAHRRKSPWFPLSKNMRPGHRFLPEFPVSAFNEFFSLPTEVQAFYKKYLSYRELENAEERFLGFFRLLEKLCYQKESFVKKEELSALLERASGYLIKYFDDRKNVRRLLSKLLDLNESKLNTAGCIVRFLKTIQNEQAQRWRYDASNIESICRLRNDLTHANEMEPDDLEIDAKAKFIEALLAIRLLVYLGVSLNDASYIAQRIDSHHLAEKPAKFEIVTSSAI